MVLLKSCGARESSIYPVTHRLSGNALFLRDYLAPRTKLGFVYARWGSLPLYYTSESAIL